MAQFWVEPITAELANFTLTVPPGSDPVSLTIVEIDGAPCFRLEQLSGADNDGGFFAVYDPAGDVADAHVRTETRSYTTRSLSASHVNVGLGARIAVADNNGYLNAHGPAVYSQYSVAAGATTNLGDNVTPPADWSATWHTVDLQVTGATIRSNRWNGTHGTEGAWSLSVTNSTYTSGGVGFWHQSRTNRGYVSLFRYLAIGTGGDSPPTGPVGSTRRFMPLLLAMR